MKSKFLLPHRFKLIGWILFIPSFILGISNLHFNFEFDFAGDLTDEIAASVLMVALLCLVFSKEKMEDEYIQYLRSESLKIAVLVNYLILLASIIFVYNEPFLYFMVYNMFTVLIFFLIHFYYTKWKHIKGLGS
jgi:hypothetical protein